MRVGRLLLLVVLCVSFLLPSFAQQTASSSPQAVQYLQRALTRCLAAVALAPAPCFGPNQEQIVPYWTTETRWKSELHLRNNPVGQDQPDEQMWIDVGKLIREHVADKSGKALPGGPEGKDSQAQ
jgi:hypothetical protein